MKLLHNDFAFAIKSADDAGTIEGYASTFGGAPDAYGDVIAPGAFSATLAAHRRAGTAPLMLWGHDGGSPPIGNWVDLAEDGKGLWVKGEIDLEDPMGSRVHRALKRGSMKGLSIGYETKDSEVDPKRPGVRILKAVDLWEVSPVNFPAQPRAAVDTVKMHIAGGGLPSPRELEEALRELGLSQKQAVTIVNHGLPALLRRDSGAAPDAVDLLAALRT